jgi:hypothetical protein
MKKTGFYLVLLSLLSCTTQQETTKPLFSYFSLSGYAKAEQTRTNTQLVIKKVVNLNGKIEEKPCSTADFTKALALIAESDINKPAWSDAFSIDSVAIANGQHQLRYTATKEQIPVKEIFIDRQADGIVTKIHILKKLDSFLAVTEMVLDYWPDSLLRLNHRQGSTAVVKDSIMLEYRY